MARASRVGLDVVEAGDIDIRVPAGATPKDGPNARVAMFTALVSLVTGPKRRGHDVGNLAAERLLPIGGIKEKVAAAAGLARVMLPARTAATTTASLRAPGRTLS